MALVPNWIDIANGAYGEGVSSGQMERIVKDGNILWGAISNNNGMFLYKSLDAGVTWTDTTIEVGNGGGGGSGPASNNASAVAVIHEGHLFVFSIISSLNNLWYTYKDLSDLSAFTDWALIHNASLFTTSQGRVCAASRPDGSLVIAASYNNAGSYPTTIVKKLSAVGGSWSTLTHLYSGGTTFCVLQNGVRDTNGDLYFFTEETGTPFGTPPTTLECYRVNASDDSVGGPFEVDGGIEDGFISVNMGPPALSGTSLMVSNVYQFQDDPTTYAVHKVWFADTSNLSSWTSTTVNGTADLIYGWSAGDGQTVFSSCVHIGGVPWVYYLTPYPAALSPYPNWKLWRSSYVSAAWTTPEEWYDPGDADAVLDPLRAGHNGLDTLANFQLVKGFTNGVGIMVDVEDWYAGYGGPPLAVNNYASAGGALAGPGSYASA